MGWRNSGHKKKPPDKRPIKMPTSDKKTLGQKTTKLFFSMEKSTHLTVYSCIRQRARKMTKMTLFVVVVLVFC